jgi:hypothetical protein
MQALWDFFASNPEAMATLLVAAIGGLVSIVAWLYSILAAHPLIVRILANRSLVYVDSVLSDRVQATFDMGEGTTFGIEQLRQIDLEIFNSHPRQVVKDCSITLNLRSPDATVLGITAANSDGRTPRLGGREVRVKVEEVSLEPIDPLLGSRSDLVCPAIVIQIPYLGHVFQRDRLFLRITYDGPRITPEVRGAKPMTKWKHHAMQRLTWTVAAAGVLGAYFGFMTKAYRALGRPFWDIDLYRTPPGRAALVCLVVCMSMLLVGMLRENWLRPLPALPYPHIPSPAAPDDLTKIQFYDTMQQ